MSEYINHSRGPGSIAALMPGAALWHPPTISSNDPRGAMYIANKHIIGRDIKVRAGATKGLAEREKALIKKTHGATPIKRVRERGYSKTQNASYPQVRGIGTWSDGEGNMSQYIRATYGPGDIAALPPTIGAGDGGPTIGAEDVGHQIKKAFPFNERHIPGAATVEAAGVKLPVNGLYGMGNNGNNPSPAWLVPVGVGLVLGGLYVMLSKKREHGGVLPNPLASRGRFDISEIPGDMLERVSKRSFWRRYTPETDARLHVVFRKIVDLVQVNPTERSFDNAYKAFAHAAETVENPMVVVPYVRALTRMAMEELGQQYRPPYGVIASFKEQYKKMGLIQANRESEPTCNGCR